MAHEENHGQEAHGHEYVADPVKKAADYRLILIVAIVLGVLTVLEALLADLGSAILMFIIAFIKAGLVGYFFMHIYRLWREDAH